MSINIHLNMGKLKELATTFIRRSKSTPQPTRAHSHPIVNKGWGHELIIVNKPSYCLKQLHFQYGKQCSWHKHKLKDETFYVHSGSFLILIGYSRNIKHAKSLRLKAGDSLHIPTGMYHRMMGTHITTPNILTEVSTQHFDHDSIREVKGD